MSFITFNSPSTASLKESASASTGSLRGAFSRWIMANHGASYRKEVKRQRARANAQRFKGALTSRGDTAGLLPEPDSPLVGIVGGGFAGLFAGLILQSLGIECEVFESSDRVGGRIFTWYSTDYSPEKKDNSGLYGEVGGMRLPQFSADMLPVQQLGLSVNSVLERNGLSDDMVYWRKFYYDSPVQRLRFNNMPSFITLAESSLNSLNFDVDSGGDIPEVWLTAKMDSNGNDYLPINMILEMVNNPFIAAINNSFAEGFALLMQYDQHSMWDYLTNVFTLGDLGEYYDPAMGAKSDFVPWTVASFLETTNVGTGMYSVSFVEMVIAVYDWGGSKNPYDPADNGIYMLTVNNGMQHFPDACRTVLDLEQGVTTADGHLAQVQVGMARDKDGKYSYSAPNLTPDAQPPKSVTSADGAGAATASAAATVAAPAGKQRVFLEHKVVGMKHDPDLYDGHGGMKLTVKSADSKGIEKQYPYVISTLPSGAYLNGELKVDLLENISFAKAQGIREINYMASFKAFLTFKSQFWATLGERQKQGLGAAATDRPNRQIIYPSYGYDASEGVLQVYCWAEDAQRLGALSDEEAINECLKGIAFLYPETNSEGINIVYDNFSGYDPERTTKTWFWDSHAGGGAFALFNPEQFKNIYPTLITPEFDGCLNFAGEACSVHHGWIVGALDSAYNAVYHILQNAGATEKVLEMEATWGQFSPPDIAPSDTANDLEYVYEYNEVDRKADSIPPGATKSIYGDSDFEFKGNIPAAIKDYERVPQSMKKTITDTTVLNMLNDLWNDNVAQRAIAQMVQTAAPASETAVEMLERIYYGDNFQTIPKPLFWLKDDDEFARQQLAGFMPNLLQKVSQEEVTSIVEKAGIPDTAGLPLGEVTYIADYRQYLNACTVIPVDYYLAKPIVFFKVTRENELMPLGIQLDQDGELFTPAMPNAENAWLLAKMQTNCAGQSLHDVGYHQLYTHQIAAMVSIALFSEEVFNPLTPPISSEPFQEHPVFKLLSPHVVKTAEFQQTIYDRGYHPNAQSFPDTRNVNGSPGVYNIGFVYDLIFSCGRIGNYQLQDRMYHNDGQFRFLDLAVKKDALKRGVENTPFSYAYVHDASLWYDAMEKFVGDFVDVVYGGGDAAVASDIQLQRFFSKLIPAFNHVEGSDQPAERFPAEVVTTARLKEVLTMFVWQFSVQHTVVNDGAYNQAAFVPNASTLMMPLPGKSSADWTPADVLACLPSQTATYPTLGNMNFMDVQINASVTGQGPYPETVFGRGVLEPSIDFLQDTYGFTGEKLRRAVDRFYQGARAVGDAIQQRQGKDIGQYYKLHPQSNNVPETVIFPRVAPADVMNAIET
jgi:monoamine oxidase